MTQNDMKVEPVDLIDLDKNSYLTNQTDRIESIDRFTATFLPLVGLFGLFCQGGGFSARLVTPVVLGGWSGRLAKTSITAMSVLSGSIERIT